MAQPPRKKLTRTPMPILLVLLLVVGAPPLFKKDIRLRRFRSDQDDIWQDCSSKYASFDGVGFLIYVHVFVVI